jgi:hypothetical protein
MKKIAFCILPLFLLLGTSLWAKTCFSFSLNLHALPLFQPPIVHQQVVVRPPPPTPPHYVKKKIIRHYYSMPYHEEEEEVIILPIPYP